MDGTPWERVEEWEKGSCPSAVQADRARHRARDMGCTSAAPIVDELDAVRDAEAAADRLRDPAPVA